MRMEGVFKTISAKTNTPVIEQVKCQLIFTLIFARSLMN